MSETEVKYISIKDLKETIVKELESCVPRGGPIPKTALVMKIQEILQEGCFVADHFTISSVVELLAYEGAVVIDEGARAKQYCFLPKHLKAVKR